MKKILLAVIMFTAFTSATFADGKNSNAKLLAGFKTAIKSINASSWKTTDAYKKTSFAFNGTNVNAYVTPEGDELIGFGITIKAEDLPQGAMQNIERKFKGWSVSSAILFIDAQGHGDYYAQVTKDTKSLALSVSAKGKVNIYAKMPN